MTPMDPKQLSPTARQVFKLIEFDPNETLLFEIRKHWFGMFIIYSIGMFVIFGALAIALGAALMNDENFEPIKTPVVLLAILFSLLAVAGTSIAAYLYKSNVMLITSEKVAQLLAQGIFNRKVSQLSIGDVQDVTVRQSGIFPHAFNYGTIVIETAGEQQNYTYTYTPDPYKAAKALVGAHEENLKLHGN
jgi:membrane protein YdbS with pleckstrin-like domain